MSKIKKDIVLDIKEKDIDAIFESRYGGTSWRNLLSTMPHREADLKDFIELELELIEVKRLIKSIRNKEGSLAANIGETDSGKDCIAPLQQLLRNKRSQRQAQLRDLRGILENISGDEDDRLSALDEDDEDEE